MADFDTGDIVRLGAAMLSYTSDAVVNVFNVRIEAGGGLGFAAAGQDFQEYVELLFRPLVAYYQTELVGDHISVKNETQDTVWGSIAWNPSFTGTSVVAPVPSQLAILAWGRTAKSRVQLRKYLGPWATGNLAEGLWTAGTQSAAAALMADHISLNVMTNGLELRGVAYNRTAGTYEYALSATASITPVVQRRRRRGRGS